MSLGQNNKKQVIIDDFTRISNLEFCFFREHKASQPGKLPDIKKNQELTQALSQSATEVKHRSQEEDGVEELISGS